MSPLAVELFTENRVVCCEVRAENVRRFSEKHVKNANRDPDEHVKNVQVEIQTRSTSRELCIRFFSDPFAHRS